MGDMGKNVKGAVASNCLKDVNAEDFSWSEDVEQALALAPLEGGIVASRNVNFNRWSNAKYHSVNKSTLIQESRRESYSALVRSHSYGSGDGPIAELKYVFPSHPLVYEVDPFAMTKDVLVMKGVANILDPSIVGLGAVRAVHALVRGLMDLPDPPATHKCFLSGPIETRTAVCVGCAYLVLRQQVGFLQPKSGYVYTDDRIKYRAWCAVIYGMTFECAPVQISYENASKFFYRAKHIASRMAASFALSSFQQTPIFGNGIHVKGPASLSLEEYAVHLILDHITAIKYMLTSGLIGVSISDKYRANFKSMLMFTSAERMFYLKINVPENIYSLYKAQMGVDVEFMPKLSVMTDGIERKSQISIPYAACLRLILKHYAEMCADPEYALLSGGNSDTLTLKSFWDFIENGTLKVTGSEDGIMCVKVVPHRSNPEAVYDEYFKFVDNSGNLSIQPLLVVFSQPMLAMLSHAIAERYTLTHPDQEIGLTWLIEYGREAAMFHHKVRVPEEVGTGPEALFKVLEEGADIESQVNDLIMGIETLPGSCPVPKGCTHKYLTPRERSIPNLLDHNVAVVHCRRMEANKRQEEGRPNYRTPHAITDSNYPSLPSKPRHGFTLNDVPVKKRVSQSEGKSALSRNSSVGVTPKARSIEGPPKEQRRPRDTKALDKPAK